MSSKPDDVLVVVIMGDSEESLNPLRDEVGNEWMREHIVPHAAARPTAQSARWLCRTSGGPPGSPGIA